MRFVKPYVYPFETCTKGRWHGRTLAEVYGTEFGAHSPGYYVKAIEQGRITVNGEAVSPSFVLRGGERICHYTHRHEPPVRGTQPDEIEIVADTADLVVVNKPSTVPMHPCGAYKYNSMMHILDDVREGEGLHIVHRLDRLTAGLALFAKTPEVAKRFGEDLRAGHTQKTYLARVIGDFGASFPAKWFRSDKGLLEADATQLGWAAVSMDTLSMQEAAAAVQSMASSVRIQQSIKCASHRDGVHVCAAKEPADSAAVARDESAKEATTIFTKLSFNGHTSLVECHPLHGRTHQLRLHLQHMGHPIANDPCYGGTLHYGDPLGGIPDFGGIGTALATEGNAESKASSAVEAVESDDDAQYTAPREEGEDLEAFLVRTCRFCHR